MDIKKDWREEFDSKFKEKTGFTAFDNDYNLRPQASIAEIKEFIDQLLKEKDAAFVKDLDVLTDAFAMDTLRVRSFDKVKAKYSPQPEEQG